MTVGHGLQEYSRGKMGVIGISEAGFYCDDTHTNYKYICTTLNCKSKLGASVGIPRKGTPWLVQAPSWGFLMAKVHNFQPGNSGPAKPGLGMWTCVSV